MKKPRILLAFGLIFCMLLSACELQDDATADREDGDSRPVSTSKIQDREDNNSLPGLIRQNRAAEATEDADMQKVLSYLEKGEYKKAKETFEDKILGNLSKEETAQEAFDAYINLAVKAVNKGELTMDDANLFMEAANRAELGQYLGDFNFRLTEISFSMECYSNGKALLDAKEYERAYAALVCVSDEDVNFLNAVEMIYEMGIELSASEEVDDLQHSSMFLNALWGDFDRYKEHGFDQVGKPELAKLLHDVTLKTAEKLEEKKQIHYAAAEYANASLYSGEMFLMYLSDESLDSWKECFMYSSREREKCYSLVREWNTLIRDSYSIDTYYVLTEDGVDVRGGSPSLTGAFLDRAPVQLAWKFGYSDKPVVCELRADGNVWFNMSERTAQYQNYATLKDGTWSDTSKFALPMKVYYMEDSGEPNVAVLYSDGTVDVYVTTAKGLYTLQSQNNVLDFLTFTNQSGNLWFAILTKAGDAYCTSGSQLSLEGWENIVEISAGGVNPKGYDYSSPISISAKSFLYGLDVDGNIHYTEASCDSGMIPTQVIITLDEPVVRIADGAYLTESGVLGSIEPRLNDWLQLNYGQYQFKSIANASNGEARDARYAEWDVIAATTDDDEVFVIDLEAAREEIRHETRKELGLE